MRCEPLEERNLLSSNTVDSEAFRYSSDDFTGAEIRALDKSNSNSILFSDENAWFKPHGYNVPTFNDEGHLVAIREDSDPDLHTMLLGRAQEHQCFGLDGVFTLPDTHYMFSFDVRFPEAEQSWLSHHDWAIVMQMWGPREVGEISRMPPFALYASGHTGTPTWRLGSRADTRAISNTREYEGEFVESVGEVNVGEWQHFDIEYVVDPFGNGLVRAWLDGEMVVDRPNVQTGYFSKVAGAESGPLNPSFGLYTPNSGEQMEAHFDNIQFNCNGDYGHSIAGTVTGSEGETRIFARSAKTNQVYETVANEYGVYALNVPPAKYSVWTVNLATGQQSRAYTVDATRRVEKPTEPEEESPLVQDFELQAMYNVSGRVSSDSGDVTVTLINLSTSELQTYSTDETGLYNIDVEPGIYNLKAADNVTGLSLSKNVDLSNRDQVTDISIRQQLRRISGNIDSLTPNQLVVARDRVTDAVFTTHADENGNYAMNLPPATYRVRAKDLGTGRIRTILVDLREEDAVRDMVISPTPLIPDPPAPPEPEKVEDTQDPGVDLTDPTNVEPTVGQDDSSQELPVVIPPSVTAYVGDVDGDGKDDPVVLEGTTWLVHASSSESDEPVAWTTMDSERIWTDHVVSDFTGDGLDDLAARDDLGKWWVYRSTGSSFEGDIWGAWLTRFEWANVLFGDFNGDNRTDILGQIQSEGAGNGDWWASYSEGDKFTPRPTQPLARNVSWQNLQVGDFNGDGLDDVFGIDTETSCLCVGISTGESFEHQDWGQDASATSWTELIVTDVDNDGRSDILARDAAGVWTFAMSTDDDQFSSRLWSIWDSSESWGEAMVADVNGDGIVELIARAESTGEIWATPGSLVLRRRGLPQHKATNWATDHNFEVFGDFDGDGFEELFGWDPEQG